MDDFITVHVFTFPQEAYVFKGKLEAEGIRCFLKDEYTVQSHNFISNAVGGVKLQVYREDLPKAEPLLMEMGLGKKGSGPDKEEEIENKLQGYARKHFSFLDKFDSKYLLLALILIVILILLNS